MRILSQVTSMDMTSSVSSANQNTSTLNNTQKQVTQQVSKSQNVDKPTVMKTVEGIKNTAENREKLQEAVDSLNDFMKEHMPTSTTSKFRLHEGLDRYYVQVVDSQTDEVVKEIPPEQLLNAFYEMQKLVGMIVDEKI